MSSLKGHLAGCRQRPGVQQLLQQQVKQQAWCIARHKHRCRDSSLLSTAAAAANNQPDALQQQQEQQLQDLGLGQENARLQPSHTTLPQQPAEQQQTQLQQVLKSLDQHQVVSQQELIQRLSPVPAGQQEPQLQQHQQQEQQQLQQLQQQDEARQQQQEQRSALSGQAADQQSPQQARLQLLQRMLVFMGPALIIPLGDPLMTLTDTIFMGQCAGTRELAAMGPANIVFSFTQYVFQALQVAAISLISDDLRKGLVDRAEHTFQLALTLALSCGVVVMVLMEVAAEQLIAGTGADPSLVPLAASYMRIRALAQPAVLITMASQGGLLAQRDSRTPALAVMLAVAVNIASNLVAVAWLGLGLQGAAATTVATQVVGAAVLLLVARKRSTLEPGLCPVDLTALTRFASTMGPLSVTYICKNLCYILLQTAAASLSMVQLAAHQAVFSIWNLLAFATTPLEQAALSYIPACTSRTEQRTTLQLLLAVSVVTGIVCGSIACAVPLLAPQLLTKDPAVWPYMARVSPLALLAMLLTAADVGANGILLARRDLAYVARAFMFTLCALAVFVSVYVKGPYGLGLDGVWYGLVLFFGLRCVQSVGRLIVTNGKAMSGLSSIDGGSGPVVATPQGT